MSDKGYQRLINVAKSKYEIVPLRVTTRNPKYALGSQRSLKEIVSSLEKQIKPPHSSVTILGFSIGALLAYQMARHFKFRHLILCSLSPTLGRDLSKHDQRAITDLTPTQYREMSRMNYGKLKTRKVSILYGERENESLKNRSDQIAKKLKRKAIEVKNGDHLMDNSYVDALGQIL